MAVQPLVPFEERCIYSALGIVTNLGHDGSEAGDL